MDANPTLVMLDQLMRVVTQAVIVTVTQCVVVGAFLLVGWIVYKGLSK